MSLPKPYYQDSAVTIYCGDCREVAPRLEVANLVFTSPPYDRQRDYGSPIDDWAELMRVAFRRLTINPETQVLVNLGLIHRDGEVIQYWDPFICAMRAMGWRHFGWYVWDQLSGMAGDWAGRLAPSFEFVFHFNRVAKSPNKTIPTKGGYVHGPGLKNANGTATKEKTHHGRPTQPFKIPDSVIRTARETEGGTIESSHPARFPVRFAKHLIAAFSNDGETVLDPFMGSGTTLRAAKDLGRKAIGIEIEEKYCEIAARRMEQEVLAFDVPQISTHQPELVDSVLPQKKSA